MGIFEKVFGKKEKSAKKAKERLLITLQYERALTQKFPQLEQLKKEIMEIVKKYDYVRDVNIKTAENNLEIEVLFKE